MSSFPHRPSYPRPPARQSPRWLVVLLPFTLCVALARLLVRSVARSVLAVPEVWREAVVPTRIWLWVAGIAIGVRWVFVADVSPFQRELALDWYWELVRLFGFPRALDGFWARGVSVYPDHWYGIVWPFVLLTLTWTGAVTLVRIPLFALRRGFSADGESNLAWPRPRARAPLPFGFVLNVLAVLVWVGLPAAFVLALPPAASVLGHRFWTIEVFTRGWPWLRWLGYPRYVDAAGATALRAQEQFARDHDAVRGAYYFWPTDKVGHPVLVLVGSELATIAVAVALGLTAVWAWRSWRAAAAEGGALGFGRLGESSRSAPGWTVVLLPVTFPLALLGLGFWKGPRWFPKLVGGAIALYAVGWVAAFVGWYVVLVRANPATPLLGMRVLRHDWRLLDRRLRFLHWFDPWIDAIPHTSRRPPSGGQLWLVVVWMSSVTALAVAGAIVAAWLAAVVLKRILEVLAR